MLTPEDDVVAGPCSIAVRDYGGTGTPLLLLHGMGRNLSDWTPIAQLLAADHRVVSMDLRSHGRSDPGPWQWDSVLDDISRVIDVIGLRKPAIVGHSLGGMLATLFSARGRETHCVVNVDGYGYRPASRYPGIPGDEVLEYQNRMRRASLAARPDAGGPITESTVTRIRRSGEETAQTYGIPIELELATVDRSLRQLPDGTFTIAPTVDALAEMLPVPSLNSAPIDWLAVFQRVNSPLMLYNCLADVTAPSVASAVDAARASEIMTAHRRGLERDLTLLMEGANAIRLRTIQAHHMVTLTMPDTLASEIHDFVESVR